MQRARDKLTVRQRADCTTLCGRAAASQHEASEAPLTVRPANRAGRAGTQPVLRRLGKGPHVLKGYPCPKQRGDLLQRQAAQRYREHVPASGGAIPAPADREIIEMDIPVRAAPRETAMEHEVTKAELPGDEKAGFFEICLRTGSKNPIEAQSFAAAHVVSLRWGVSPLF